MDLRAVQQPIKDAYRADPDQARITLTARGSAADAPVACSVDLGRAIYEAIIQRDYPLIQAGVLVLGVIVVVMNLLVDLTYRLLNPRVKLG